MRWLLFLSRVAFIFGLCVLLQFTLDLWQWNRKETISSSFILVGYVLAVLLVPVVSLSYLIVAIITRKLYQYVPVWLVISNLVLFLFILAYIFYLDDPYYR